jgi:ribose transport system substrate-binding protein
MAGISRGRSRRDVLGLAAGGLAGALLWGTSGCATTTVGAATGRKKMRIALANSYIGNTWRIEMENQWKAALQMQPYASLVEGSIYNANNNLRDQSEQMANLVSLRVDAIVIDAASPTALNGIIDQAADRGILVVAFDNTVTTKKAINVNTDQFKFGELLASHLVKQLGGKGNVIMVTGVPGTTVDADRNTGADRVWKKHPGIKVVSRYTGMWDSSVAQKNTAAILPSLPRIDGIWAQGGTDGILKAFLAAGRKLPPTCGESENGFRKFLAGLPGYPKVHGLSIGQPPYLCVVALEVARQVLRGDYPRRDVTIPFPTVTDKTVRVGKTVFPKVEDSFFTGFTDTGPDPVLHMCLDSALTGDPCQHQLHVTLPKG